MWHHLIALIIKAALRNDTPKEEVRTTQQNKDLFRRAMPDVSTSKMQFGAKFSILLKIFNSHDLIAVPSLKDDPKKYEAVTAATLHALPAKQNLSEVSMLLTKVLGMWFGSSYWDLKRKKELDQDVFNFKTVNFFGGEVKSEKYSF